MHLRLPSETENVEFLTSRIRLACFVLSRRTHEAVFELSEISLGWLPESFEQERAFRGRHAVPKSR